METKIKIKRGQDKQLVCTSNQRIEKNRYSTIRDLILNECKNVLRLLSLEKKNNFIEILITSVDYDLVQKGECIININSKSKII